jgi:hypothetical protein
MSDVEWHREETLAAKRRKRACVRTTFWAKEWDYANKIEPRSGGIH